MCLKFVCMCTRTKTDYRGRAEVKHELKLRFLCHDDLDEVKKLCSAWFPVEYPDAWYKDITSDKRFFSLAAVLENRIVGLIVAEVKTRARCHREDVNILSATFPSSTQVTYILSLGVVKEYRRRGIASALLSNLLTHLGTSERCNVKATYLHVLASNTTAIRFYERHNFRRHEYLPNYYAIKGNTKDGFSYVLYINGGQPPWSFIDYMKQFGSYLSRIQPCTFPQAVARHTRNFFTSRRSWLPSLPSVNLPNMNLPNVNIISRIRGQGGSSSSSLSGSSVQSPSMQVVPSSSTPEVADIASSTVSTSSGHCFTSNQVHPL